MPIIFRDSGGNRGRITDEFFVEYDGPIAVEAYVREIEVETESTERAIEELIIGLVQDLDIDEARRAEARYTPLSP